MSCKYNVIIDEFYKRLLPIRKNDRALMDMTVESYSFSTNEIIKINHCRLYLQVHILSDITNRFESLINCCALYHIKDPDKVGIYNWPFQPNPSKQSWKLWDKAIETVWSHSEQRNLHLTFGIHIINPPFKSIWFYHEHSETLYYKISTMSYSIYKKTSGQIPIISEE